mmetsp:Transcript_9346/g.21384  ORF Transcript_9346/g.21384 Transcript_9346/m.21384 type:complete len:382 (+) Transcript_9346:215-1360(+)
MLRKTTLLPLLAIILPARDVSGFAVSSSSSPKRKVKTNQGKATGGFGKKDDSVPITHTKDMSESTLNLENFLLQWKSEGLGSDDSGSEVGFDMDSGIRGMYANKSFRKGDIVCKIPSDVALALTDPSSATDVADGVADGAMNFIQWYASNEEAKQTWRAYLDTLPTKDMHFDPTPDFYSEQEIQALEFPKIVADTTERKQQIANLAQKSGVVSFDELQFATWLVASRSFAIKISVDDGELVREGAVSTREKVIRVLLPYLDMINHSSDNANAELHLIDPEKDDAWFAIRATRPIKKGKEISISYGASGVETSLGLLSNYGFVPEENKIDELFLKKGGDNCIETLGGWSTTLAEDELELERATGNMVNVLKLRIKLKRSYPE